MRLKVLWDGWKREDVCRVLVRTYKGFEEDLWRSALEAHVPAWRDRLEVQFVSDGFGFRSALREADVCSTMTISGGILRRGRRLRWVNTLIAGINVHELEGAPTSIHVTSSRGIASRSIAEHVLGLMIALDRGFLKMLERQRLWTWSQEQLLGRPVSLKGKVVTVVGLGSVGFEVAKLCRSMEMRVVAVRRMEKDESGLCDHVCSLEKLHSVLPTTDVLVLTLPLNDRTYHLVGERELKLMKSTAFVINVARGGLIDEYQLANALRKGMIAGAGLDVLAEEPPRTTHPLKECPNLIITPHVAGNIHNFRSEIAARFARNLESFLSGSPLEGVVPPDYWGSQAEQIAQ